MNALRIGCLMSGCLLSACDSPQWDWDRMIHQAKVEPMQATAFFPDERAMRPPVDGTVSREAILDDGRAPIALDRAAIARGRDRFEVYCAACHGLRGDGDSLVARNMELRKPPSLIKESMRQRPLARFVDTMTRGYGLMPSYKSTLSVDERWEVAAYIRALQLRQSVAVDSLPPELRDEARKELP